MLTTWTNLIVYYTQHADIRKRSSLHLKLLLELAFGHVVAVKLPPPVGDNLGSCAEVEVDAATGGSGVQAAAALGEQVAKVGLLRGGRGGAAHALGRRCKVGAFKLGAEELEAGEEVRDARVHLARQGQGRLGSWKRGSERVQCNQLKNTTFDLRLLATHTL